MTQAAKAKAWQKHSWRVRRYWTKMIAYKDRMIIFAEVKTRTGNGFGEPEDFVDMRKQRLLPGAVDEYIYLME